MKAISNAPRFAKTALALLFALCAAGAFGQATLSVQGVLTKSDGTAVDDGQYSITFKLWDAAGGGTAVHTETIPDVQTTGGVYSVVLGDVTPISAPFDKTYWLGVTVGGGTELTPRPRLTHAPYALSLQGQSNKFPSTGTVIADRIRVGASSSGGYTFDGVGSDEGLLQLSDAQVSLFTSGAERVRVSDSDTRAMNELKVWGRASSNTGFGFHVNGTTNGTGLFFNTTGTTASISAGGSERYVAGPNNDNFFKVPSGSGGYNVFQSNAAVDGQLEVGKRVRTAGKGAALPDGGGFTFNYSGYDDSDSGLFGAGDGEVQLYSNNNLRVWMGSDTRVYGHEIHLQSEDGKVFIDSMDNGFHKAVHWDPDTKMLSYVNSSRRFKENIRPFTDDWRLILRSQPRMYTRPGKPGRWELGYIAEEMDSIGLHQLVERDAKGTIDGYAYEWSILYLTEVLKLHDADIEKLKAEVAELRAERASLQSANADMRKQQAALVAQMGELAKRMGALESTGGATGSRK